MSWLPHSEYYNSKHYSRTISRTLRSQPGGRDFPGSLSPRGGLALPELRGLSVILAAREGRTAFEEAIGITDRRQQTTRSADGTEIGFVTVGSGPPLVLVHGAWNWADHWLGVAEHLAESFTCSTVDRRARGSSGDGDDYSFDREIEDIAAVLEAVGPGASLLGHSSGAIYSLETARQVPVERLVLYEPPLVWAERGDPSGLVNRVRDLVAEGRPDDAATLFFAEEGRLDEDRLELLRSQPAWERMVGLAAICVREWEAILAAGLTVDRYRTVTVPTQLLAGSENLDHPSMATEQLGAALPNVRTVVLDGFGHEANLLDPALVASEVSAFLASADT